MGSLNKTYSESGIRISKVHQTLEDVNFDKEKSIIETKDAKGRVLAT